MRAGLSTVRRVCVRVVRRDSRGFPVRGGPFHGLRVREVATTATGEWVKDRLALCRPENQRQSCESYPYVLRAGTYVWNPTEEQR